MQYLLPDKILPSYPYLHKSNSQIQMMRHSHKSQDWFLYGSIYMVFLLGHMVILKNIDVVWIYPDSIVYYQGALLPLTDSQFYGGRRPPVALLFYKLFGDYEFEDHISNIAIDDVSLSYGQTMSSMAAFSFLAFACTKTAQTGKGRLSLFIFTLLFSFVPSILRWNFVMLSESFSISLFAVFVAVWILFLRTKRLSWLVGVALVALLWGGVRDTNAYVLVMIALVIMTALVRSCNVKKTYMMTLCACFVCIFTLSNFSNNTGNRWIFPFYNNIGQRILPVPEHVLYFSDHGMPINPELLMRSGKWASSDDWAFYNDPHLEKFRAWSLEHGKMTYIKFLITHFTYSMTAPVFQVPMDFLGFAYDFHVYPDQYYHFPLSRVSLHLPIALIYFLIGYSLTIYYAFIWWQRKWLYRYPYLSVPLIMVLLSAPHAWLTWHADAAETARHALTSFIQFQLGFSWLLIYVWDRYTWRPRIPSEISDHGIAKRD